jgi:hypothetical protein
VWAQSAILAWALRACIVYSCLYAAVGCGGAIGGWWRRDDYIEGSGCASGLVVMKELTVVT